MTHAHVPRGHRRHAKAIDLLRPSLIVAIVTVPVALVAQGTGTPPADPHRYPLPTYAEDWRALKGADRTDFWDPVKFVSLSAKGTTSLSFGGEARITYERFGNQNFGLTPPDPDGYRRGQRVPLRVERREAT